MKRWLVAAAWLFLAAPLFSQEALYWKDPLRHLTEATKLIEEGKYNLALESVERFEEDYKHVENKSVIPQGDAAYYRAIIAKSTGNEAAEDLFLDYISQYRGHHYNNIAYYQVGDLYYTKKDYRSALDWFDKVEEKGLKGSEREDFIFRRSYSYFALKNFSAARAGFDQLANKPDGKYYADAVYYSGMSSYFLKEYNRALEQLRSIEDHNKYRNVVPVTITQILFEQKDYTGVIAYAEPMLQKNNNLRNVPEMQHLVGMAYFEQLQFDKAAEYLEAYVRDAKSVSKEDYYMLGFVYYKAGKYKEAISPLQQLTSLNNGLAQNALYVLGQCYLKLNQKSNARSAFQSASRMDFDKPTKEEATFQFAKLSYELGFNNEALLVLKTFNRDFPNSKFAAEADDLLVEVFLRTRAYDEAMETIEKMPTKSTQVQAAYQKMAYYRAVEQFNDGRMAQADALLDKSLKYPQDRGYEALAYYLKGDIAHIRADYNASIEWINKYLPLSASVSPQLSTKVTKGNGHYILGYNTFKQKRYSLALDQFRAAFDLQYSSDNNNKLKLYPDAVLRAADCFFMTRDYPKAKEYYDIVVKRGYDALDYALYQKAIIEGLQGNVEEKLAGLNTLSKNYPRSSFADDALLESGRTLMNMERNSQAITNFNALIKNYPKSDNVPQAYLNLGLIAFNADQYDEALRNYQTVIKNYPNTTASKEALLAIKDVYIAKGDAEGYLRYIQTVPGAGISASAQDSLTFQSAEGLYQRGEYERALKGFDDYLTRFPNGYFATPARFYRGELHFRKEDYNRAKNDYVTLLDNARDVYSERAANRVAWIFYYQDKNYPKALEYYNLLLEYSSKDETRVEALGGQMRSNFQLKNYSRTQEAITALHQSRNVPDIMMTESLFYRAMINMDARKYKEARDDFNSVISRIDNEWTAASRYNLARILHLEKKYADAEKAAFDVINNYPNYPYWLAKTYILLADNYLAQDNAFQAKVTLESVLDNYEPEDEVKQEARQKYNAIVEEENNNSKIRENNTGTELQFDD